MAHVIGLAALLTAALFAGAAIYVSLVEHPARMRLDAASALRQWKPSYVAATKMQASLALVSGLLGLIAAAMTGDARWVLGALLILANLPYTLLRMIPTNKALQAIPEDQAGPTSEAMLRRWAGMHAVRYWLGIGAALAYVWAAS